MTSTTDTVPEPLDVEGVVVIDKGTGLTSHDVVGRIRRLVGSRPGRRGRRRGPKVGHAGTLDPDATGVLVVCLGRATKLVPYLQATQKTYDATMRLGRTTDTLDAAGKETSLTDASNVTFDDLCTAAAKYRGDIEQIPPMVSAVKIGGERLHAKARRGETVERPPRPVTIYDLVLGTFTPGEAATAEFLVTCSAGTYVRTLADDIGQDLGVGAHLTALRRLGSGNFTVENAVTLDDLAELAEADRFTDAVIDPVSALSHLPVVTLDDHTAMDVRHGKPTPATGNEGPVAAVDGGGKLVAVLRDRGRNAKSEVVFA